MKPQHKELLKLIAAIIVASTVLELVNEKRGCGHWSKHQWLEAYQELYSGDYGQRLITTGPDSIEHTAVIKREDSVSGKEEYFRWEVMNEDNGIPSIIQVEEEPDGVRADCESVEEELDDAYSKIEKLEGELKQSRYLSDELIDQLTRLQKLIVVITTEVQPE